MMLIRTFAVCCQNHWIIQNLSIESKCPDKKLAHAQDDVNLHMLPMHEGMFSLGTAHIKKLKDCNI